MRIYTLNAINSYVKILKHMTLQILLNTLLKQSFMYSKVITLFMRISNVLIKILRRNFLSYFT